jgi:hypothetical protein
LTTLHPGESERPVFYLIYLMILVMWYALVAGIFLFLGVPVVLGSSGYFLVLYMGAYLRASRQALGLQSPGQAVPVAQPSVDSPAYLHYLSGPAGQDLRQVGRLSWESIRVQGRKANDKVKARWLGYGSGKYRKAIGFFLSLGLYVGSALTGLVLGIAVVGAMLAWGVLFVLAKGLLYLLRGADAGLSAIRGINLSCPSCHQRVVYPAYECPNCAVKHYNVRPGKYGVLRRTCRCGSKLPTLLLLGSHKMNAFCPHPGCGAQMATGAGTAREIVVPMLGATTSGKTRMMLALAATLVDQNPLPGLTASAADEPTKIKIDQLQRALRSKDSTDKTLAIDAMRAYSFNLDRRGGVKRLMHLYDPPGERLSDSARLHELRFMRMAHSFIFIVDPLAIPDVWDSLDGGSQRSYQQFRSAQPPDFIFSQVLQNLEGMGVQPRKKAIAVAVTKSDLTDDIPICADLGDGDDDQVRDWLSDRAGMDNMVRAIGKAFGDVRYFHTTARFTGDVDDNVRALLLWTLGRYGVN